MRLIKDKHEIELMKKACLISAETHVEAMKFVKPGISEQEMEAPKWSLIADCLYLCGFGICHEVSLRLLQTTTESTRVCSEGFQPSWSTTSHQTICKDGPHHRVLCWW